MAAIAGAAGIALLADAFDRIRETVEDVLKGLTVDELAFRVDTRANPVGWLVWHLTRVQDAHLADAFGAEQVWHAGGWEARFGLPYPADASGYAHSSADVAAFHGVSARLLAQYHQAVHEQTRSRLASLSDDDLARVVDRSWQPPVTLGVRLVSVVSDDLQHVGQAAFVRGIVRRRR